MAKKTKVGEQLEAMRTQLEAERDTILRATAPLYRERETLVAKIQPLEEQLRKLDDRIKNAEKPIYEIGNGLAQLARAAGARVMGNGKASDASADKK
jgi:chromosome segregation ATPase